MKIAQCPQQQKRQGFTLQEMLVVIGIIVVIIGLVLKATGLGKVHVDSSYIGNLVQVVYHNVGFWIVLFLAVCFGVYRKLTNPEEFLWRELPIQVVVTFVTILMLYAFSFTTATDISDVEIWNGHVTKAEYYEAWTSKHTHTDKDGKTHTSYTYHPPEWKLLSTAGDMSVSRDIYHTHKKHFNNEEKKHLFRINQSSIGDGNMYFVTCDNDRKNLIPASQAHRFINYLRASDSIRKIQGNILGFKNFLVTYPTIHDGQFGPIEIDRVIESGVKLPKGWKDTLDNQLDSALVQLGPKKEVNIIVYLVGTKDPRFAEALKESWVHGKKNDVIVVLGVPEFPNVSWAQVVSWTKVEEFKIGLRNKIMDSDGISNASALTTLIVGEIQKPKSAGGFERIQMKELEYLLGDISLPWWCQLIIIAIGGAVCWFTSHLLINNNWRTFGTYARQKSPFRSARSHDYEKKY